MHDRVVAEILHRDAVPAGQRVVGRDGEHQRLGEQLRPHHEIRLAYG
jgi:hypothetical protein